MRVRAIAIGQNGETQLAITIAEQKRRVAGNTAAVREIVVAITDLHPPRQPEPGRLISPKAFDRPLKLVVLARKHLLKRLLANEWLAFEDSAVQIGDQPVGLVQHRAVDNARRPDRGPEPYCRHLASGLFVHNVGYGQPLIHIRSWLKRRTRHLQ